MKIVIGITALAIGTVTLAAVLHLRPQPQLALSQPALLQSALSKEEDQTSTPKGDRLPFRVIPIEKPEPVPKPPSPVLQATDADLKQASEERREPKNICQRHGGWRVTTGRSWRCRYPRRGGR